MSGLSFSFVESQYTKNNSSLDEISLPSFIDYFEGVVDQVSMNVMEEIKAVKHRRFGLICDFNWDGWACDSEHFVGVFLTWSDDEVEVVKESLICCGVEDSWEEEDEDRIRSYAESMNSYIDEELQHYGLSLYANIDFIVGDNCRTSKCMADLITDVTLKCRTPYTVPLVGCAAHRLNLQRQAIYNNKYSELIDKCENFSKVLRQLKHVSFLRQVTNLYPERRNKASWTSTHSMLKRSLTFMGALQETSLEIPHEILEQTPTLTEKREVELLIEAGRNSEDCSRCFQSSRVSLRGARRLFDALIAIEPDAAQHLAADSGIVHSPHFESGIVKIQAHEEEMLTEAEKEAVKMFEFRDDEVEDNKDEKDDTSVDFVQRVLKADAEQARKRARILTTKYRCTEHVSSTSNTVERLCSGNPTGMKLVLPQYREYDMDLRHLEKLVFLRCNSHLWSVRSVQRVIDTRDSASSSPSSLSVPSGGYTHPLTTPVALHPLTT